MATRSPYGAEATDICELFGDYLQGNANRPALVMSANALGEEARSALEKSLGAFGYESPACTFATLTPATASAGVGGELDAQAVFMLVEGLDPLYVIAADARSCEALAAAFRADFPTDSPARAFGRPAAGFTNLESLLQTPDGKQRAWKILKSLPA